MYLEGAEPAPPPPLNSANIRSSYYRLPVTVYISSNCIYSVAFQLEPYIPLVVDDDGSAVTDAAEQLAGTQRLLLFPEMVLLSSMLASQCRRFPGLVDVTDFGGFETFTMVGTADGCRRFFRSLRNIRGSKCSEHTLQFLDRYSGVLFIRSSRRMFTAHLFALYKHK